MHDVLGNALQSSVLLVEQTLIEDAIMARNLKLNGHDLVRRGV